MKRDIVCVVNIQNQRRNRAKRLSTKSFGGCETAAVFQEIFQGAGFDLTAFPHNQAQS